MSDTEDIGTLSFWFKSNKYGLHSIFYNEENETFHISFYPIGWDFTMDIDDETVFFYYSMKNIWQSISCNGYLSKLKEMKYIKDDLSLSKEVVTDKEIECYFAKIELIKYGEKNDI